ncbi:MAG: hypothetical protein EOO73_30835 [Myxococcales bacterium]|nr:MAG: hypothetical protein EOO73_30835 [Myxococcales bacterium]
MTDQRTSWFQRLVGADSGNLTVIEEQLGKAKQEVQGLMAELAREREQVASRDQQLEEAKQRALAAEQELGSLRRAEEQRLVAEEEREKQHKQASGELAIARAQLARQRDELAKSTKTLAATNATLAKAEEAYQAARSQASAVEGRLADETAALQAARARFEELERVATSSGQEGAEAQRRLQAVETRSSTVEHELAGTKEALRGAEAEVQSSLAQLRSIRLERDLAFAMTNDSWRALERAVGEAAPLALALGVDTGPVESCTNLEDAASSLKTALEQRTGCQALQVFAEGDALLVELSAPQLHADASRWVVAFTTHFLEKSLSVDLGLESSAFQESVLTFRLRKAASAS